jgi:hypothetical protein
VSSRSALAAAARIEDEVVYGYGVVGAHLGGKLQRVAASRLAAHQALRDRLRAVGGTGSAAAPAYELAVPVVDAATALALAIRLEDAAGAAAYALVVASGAGGAARRLAVAMLTDVATAAARWRRISAAADGPAFPGQPVAAASASQPSITPTTSPSSSTAASGSTS